MKKYKPTILRPKTHEEWVSLRNAGVGASEVGAIMGVSHFQTAYQVWRRKRGLDPVVEESIAMRMGHYLEPVVAQLFEEETGSTIVKTSAADIIYHDPDKPYMRATPDRLGYVKRNGKREYFLVECKTTAMPIDPSELPSAWITQVQYQMRVTGIRRGYLAYLVNGRDFGYVEIVYNEDYVREIEDAVTEFWARYVEGDEEPAIVTSGDVESKWATSSEGKELEADNEAVADWQRLLQLTEEESRIKTEKEEITERMKVFMEDSEVLVFNGTQLCTYKTAKERKLFDSKTFEKDNPELAAKYMKVAKASRPFKLKVMK